MSAPIRILVIDDHVNVHLTIEAALEPFDDLVIVASGSNGREALQLCSEFQPDVVLMDIIMPLMNGLDATRAIREQFPDIKVLALSSFQDEEGVRQMLGAGAVGYVLKGGSIDDLAHTIRAVYAGQAIFSPEIARMLLQPPAKKPAESYGFTARELEVLKLMADGLNNTQIAAALKISISTVKFHISSLFTKLNVTNRVEAVAIAIEKKLLN